MIEIFVLVKFCKRLAEIAREKHRPGSWGALGALGWIGGEIIGALLASRGHGDKGSVYVMALLCGGIGVALAYAVVRSLKPLPDPNFPSARVV
ncbi:MAG: hypothetical protein IPQ07_03330 [Myxococcales bacterium]|nr:hypothetical protein [Myxococcales bacterium]